MYSEVFAREPAATRALVQPVTPPMSDAARDAMWETTHDGLVPSAVSFGTAAFDSTSALTLGARYVFPNHHTPPP